MELDQLKSATEEQLDMMIMMEMYKLPELSESDSFPASAATLELPPIQFPSPILGGSSNLPESSPALFNPCSPMPFSVEMGCSFSGKSRNPMDGSCKRNSMATMREMIFRIAAMQPIQIDPESVKAPKRRNVKISKDPQSVAARHRRERISERIRILQRLVPGGTKMDTASMLDEAIHYVKFLKTQVQSLERAAANTTGMPSSYSSINAGARFGFGGFSHGNVSSFPKGYQSTQIFSPSQLLS